MSEIAIQKKNSKITNLTNNSPKYTINVIFSGPQVVDSKSTFYIEDKSPRRQKRSNSSVNIKPAALKEFNEQEEVWDRFITGKVVQQREFDDFIEDPIFKKFFK